MALLDLFMNELSFIAEADIPQSLQTQLVPSDLPLVKIPERLPSSSLIDFNPVKSVPSLSDGSSDLLGR